ncbi:unnamed protein product [Caenorhabditis auriculariae]|uniref:Uncharacterized protein n=1 Tax=Caenorhabditis auriculariae TaxID=2777116 RepID=A0A8S1GW53_9PELO|nr:unnamed protein product [Caenorhabditis auriculariae]
MIPACRRYVKIFLIFSNFIAIFCLVSLLFPPSPEIYRKKNVRTEKRTLEESQEIKMSRSAFEIWRECMERLASKKHGEDFMNNFLSGVAKCRRKTNMWHVEVDNVKGAFFHFILPAENFTLTTVRLGASEDFIMEKYLKNTMKRFNFFGTDTLDEENTFLKNKAVYLPISVGSRTALRKTSDLRKGFTNVDVKIDLLTFLSKFVNETVIDYLMIEKVDEEDAIEMIPKFLTEEELDKIGKSICQLDFKVPLLKVFDEDYDWRIQQILDSLVSAENYATLAAERSRNHLRFRINHDVTLNKFCWPLCGNQMPTQVLLLATHRFLHSEAFSSSTFA